MHRASYNVGNNSEKFHKLYFYLIWLKYLANVTPAANSSTITYYYQMRYAYSRV